MTTPLMPPKRKTPLKRTRLPVLPSGIRLTGVVPQVDGERLVEPTFSSLKHKNVLELWVRLLALQVTQPDTTCVAALVTRHQKAARALLARIVHRTAQ